MLRKDRARPDEHVHHPRHDEPHVHHPRHDEAHVLHPRHEEGPREPPRDPPDVLPPKMVAPVADSLAFTKAKDDFMANINFQGLLYR